MNRFFRFFIVRFKGEVSELFLFWEMEDLFFDGKIGR